MVVHWTFFCSSLARLDSSMSHYNRHHRRRNFVCSHPPRPIRRTTTSLAYDHRRQIRINSAPIYKPLFEITRISRRPNLFLPLSFSLSLDLLHNVHSARRLANTQHLFDYLNSIVINKCDMTFFAFIYLLPSPLEIWPIYFGLFAF